MTGKGWTDPGSVNRNGQINLSPTNPLRCGSDHGQFVYVLHCPACEQNYGANGSDIWQRKCPCHEEAPRRGKGKPGEPLQVVSLTGAHREDGLWKLLSPS